MIGKEIFKTNWKQWIYMLTLQFKNEYLFFFKIFNNKALYAAKNSTT